MSRRRVALLGAAAAVAAMCPAVWLVSPSGSGLAGRVRARGPDVPASRVSPLLREAIVATEDERFYRHHGVDLIGVLRALPYDLTHLSLAQGASTITEQVAKNLYLHGDDRTPWRKLEDAAVALKLEHRYSKRRILAAYLDTAYFGDGAVGVAAASERYFGLSASRLDLAHASLLAGLVQAPSAYDPLLHPAAARARQVEVLRSLVRDDFVTRREAAAALATILPLKGAAALPTVTGASLSPGPAFVWWEFAFGALLAAAGGACLILTSRRRAARVAAMVLFVAGATALGRSFRVA
jgi:membrane peptidoglycan carboxypeptidase